MPDIEGPFPVKLLNTGFDDAYLSFDLNLDSAYFTSNIDGNFDIYVKDTGLKAWILVPGLILITLHLRRLTA